MTERQRITEAARTQVGYPSWFRFVVVGELVGAALLVTLRLRFLGSALLLVILAGACLTHIINQDPLTESAAAPAVLVLTAAVAWSSAPWDWRTFGRAVLGRPHTQLNSRIGSESDARQTP